MKVCIFMKVCVYIYILPTSKFLESELHLCLLNESVYTVMKVDRQGEPSHLKYL